MRVQQQAKKESVEVLSNASIPDVRLGAPTVVGTTPGTENDDGTSFDNSTPRDAVDLAEVAPVVGDATARNARRGLPPDAFPRERKFQVLNPGGKYVNEPGGGGRVHLHEGKEISNRHYDVRKLQQQGVKLKEITDVGADEIISTED